MFLRCIFIVISLLLFSCAEERETIPIPLIVTRNIPIEIRGDLSDLNDLNFHDVADFFGVVLHMQRSDSDKISRFTIDAWNSERDSHENNDFITDVSLKVTYYKPMPRGQNPTQFLEKLRHELGKESFYVIENNNYYEKNSETVNDFTVYHYWNLRNNDFVINLFFNIDTESVLNPKPIKGYRIRVEKFNHNLRRNIQLSKTW